MTRPDAIVVGSGIAGLTTALHAARGGASVTLVTKDRLEHANTRFAQGGIAAAWFPDDRAADHAADTLAAGAGLCDPDAVDVLVTEGPARIRELIDLGVRFDRGADGQYVKGLEAAHSYPRVLHAGGDATGWEIERALVTAARDAGIAIVEHAFLVDLVVDRSGAEPRVTGVDLLVDGSPVRLTARAVVLATGGAGQLYAHTTNPVVATGDGIASALRAGAAVTELEFVQFHPTVAAIGVPFLVSEAVRGEGAVLVDESGHRFAFDAHPDGELAPRDVVARAIARAMRAQGGLPALLDATGIRADAGECARFLAQRFPTIDATLRAAGIDWARQPVPVTPAAHYLMGGVATDLWGRTSVPGLFAVGETARTGVHGANRLASNSLLEGAVFGARCGTVLAQELAQGRVEGGALVGEGSTDAPALRDAPGTIAPASAPVFSRSALQELLWEYAGLERDASGLAHAASLIAAWRAQPRAPRTVADHEDENLLLVASALVDAARARTVSVGAHFRTDGAPASAPSPAFAQIATAATLAERSVPTW